MLRQSPAKYIDHTLLRPDASKKEIRVLCEEAKQYGFFSVCVNPSFVEFCAEELRGYPTKVCTVIGFPLGASSTESKAFETKDAVSKGASEVDMVINISRLKDGDEEYVRKDIEAVVREANDKALVKVIIETALLTQEEKIHACRIALSAGADYVKTSTGFSIGGATTEDIALMRKTVGEKLGVKASGGIRTAKDLYRMIESGANRIGASASVSIMKEWESERTNRVLTTKDCKESKDIIT